MTVVSYISRGALSVALSDRPTTPKTLSTSGNVRNILSCSWRSCEAWVIEIPGSSVGMYNDDPSYNGGMNCLPSLNISGKVRARNNRFTNKGVWRDFRHKLSNVRYKASVNREIGFACCSCNFSVM